MAQDDNPFEIVKPVDEKPKAKSVRAKVKELLSPALKSKASEEATEEILQELKDAELKEFKAQEKKRIRAELARDPNDRMTYITIDLAPHADRITIDGQVYFHGHRYEILESAVPTFNDIMHQTWKHENSVHGANDNAYRKPIGARI